MAIDLFESAPGNGGGVDLFADAKPKKNSVARGIADLGLGFAGGAVGATKAIADAAGAGNVVSETLDTANKGITGYLSDSAKADQQAQSAIMKEAEGGSAWEGIKAGAKAFGVAPAQTMVSGLGSIVPVLAGTAATALTGGGAPAALAVGAGVGATMGAGTVKGAIHDEIKKRGIDSGMSEADATAAATKAQEYGGDNTGNIAVGAGLGMFDAATGVTAAAGKMVRNAIIKPVATEATTAATRGLAARTALGMAGEMPLEAAQGGQEKYAANVAAQRAGYEVGTWDGVASQATLEALASAGPGALFGAMSGSKYVESKRAETPPAEENPGIAGLLPSPTYTGTPTDQMLQAETERQAAIDAADANAAAVYSARDAFEKQLRQSVTIINEPAPLQQRIDEMLNIDAGQMTKTERADYDKALVAAFSEPIGIRHDENQKEVPFTMGEYLDAQATAEDAVRSRPARQNAAQQADARLNQLATEEETQQTDISPVARQSSSGPAIPVIGALSAVANMAVQSGAHATAVAQQAAATQAKAKPAGPLSEIAAQSEKYNVQSENINAGPADETLSSGSRKAGVFPNQVDAGVGQAGSVETYAASGPIGVAPQEAPATGDQFIKTRTDGQLTWLSEKGTGENKALAKAELQRRQSGIEIPNGDGVTSAPAETGIHMSVNAENRQNLNTSAQRVEKAPKTGQVSQSHQKTDTSQEASPANASAITSRSKPLEKWTLEELVDRKSRGGLSEESAARIDQAIAPLQRAKEEKEARVAKFKAARNAFIEKRNAFSIGPSIKDAEPVSVVNGVVHIGGLPAVDYDTEADITVPEGASKLQIVSALRKGGAISSGSKVFGANDKAEDSPAEPEQNAVPAAPKTRLKPMADPRIGKYADDLRAMSKDAGWAEEGGKLLIDAGGKKTRTKWLPSAEWFLAGMINSPVEVLAAVNKAANSEPMSANEKRTISGMMDYLDRVNEGVEHGNADADVLADAGYDEQSKQFQDVVNLLGDFDFDTQGAAQDESAAMRSLGFTEDDINELTQGKPGNSEGSNEDAAGATGKGSEKSLSDRNEAGQGQQQEGEELTLARQTNTQAAAEFKRQQEEAAKKDEAPASPTVKADQVDLFNTQDSLFNSNRDAAPAVNAAKPEESKPAESKVEIADFGEKLGGAKKDRMPSMDAVLSDAEIATQPLSKIWPASEIDAIEDKFTAAVAHAARAEVPAKPRVAHKVSRWVEKVKVVRNLAQSILDGSIAKDRFAAVMKTISGLDGFAAKVALLETIDRKHWGRIGNVREYPDAYRYGENDEKIPSPSVLIDLDGKFKRFDGAKSVADIIELMPDALGDGAQSKKMQFEVRGKKGSFSINKKGDKEYRQLKTFADSKEAFTFIKDNYDELVSAWDGIKESDNVTKADIRNADNRPRTGKDRRDGKDVTAEQFSETFGFRGVEFGLWVKQGGNAKDRQGMLNQAFDAMHDLAEIVGVPPKAISLNGTLGLGFGSRGSGAASAHFEPGNLVINLTKTRGAGTLAHEWFHALDNYFARMRNDGNQRAMAEVGNDPNEYRRQNFVTYKPEPLYVHKTQRSTAITRAELERYHANAPGSGYYDPANWHKDPKHPEGVRTEVEGAFSELVNALNESPMARRARLIDKGPNGYWSRIIERGARSFENYVISKMMEGGYNNDYLANVREVQDFPRSKERYPYLLPDEVAPISEAFDNLFDTVQTKETDKGVAIFSNQDGGAIPESEWLSVGSITDQLEQLSQPFGTTIPVTVIDRVSDADPRIANDGNVASGMTFKGKIYLVREGLTDSAAVARTYWHELLHFGLRRFMTRDQYIDKLSKLYADDGWIRNKADHWIAGPEGKALHDKGDSAGYIKARGVDEALAELAENLQSNPTGYENNGFQARAIRAVRSWVADLAEFFGFDDAAKAWRGYAAQGQARELVVSTFAKLREGAPPSMMTTNWHYSDPAFMTAWHGSPHDHNKFDSSKIGTGEGAQAYGHGLYFASSKSVAEYYQSTLSNPSSPSKDIAFIDGIRLQTYLEGLDWITNPTTRLKVRVAIANSKTIQEAIDSEKGLATKGRDEVLRVLEGIKSKRFEKSEDENGRLYQVELAPSEDEYLDWDKPLSEQSEKVREAIDSLKERFGAKIAKAMTSGTANESGKYFYDDVVRMTGSPRKASDYLHSIGIRGIRYLDGSSRNAGEGSNNYVIFNDADVSITAKFNKASGSQITVADKAIYGMAAEGKSAAEILKFVATASRNPFNRQLAKLLLKTGIAPSVTVGDAKGWKFNAGEGNKYAAAYNPNTDTVALFRPAAAERNTLHEFVHAATLKALSGKGMAAAQMNALYQHVKKTGKLKGMYGMSDIDEFIAEAFTNPKFQDALRKIAAPQMGSKLPSAWHWFVRIVKGILGLPDNQLDALSQALEIGVGVMREDKALRKEMNFPESSSIAARNDFVNRSIAQWADGTLKSGVILDLGKPSGILKRFGVPDLPVTLTQRVLIKAVREKHDVEVSDLKDIVVNIQAPIAVFKSKKDGKIVAVTEARHADGNIVVALDLDVTRDSISINDVRSIYPKRDSSVAQWIADGLLLGADKHKGRDWLENSAGSNSQQPQVNAALDKSILYDGRLIRKATESAVIRYNEETNRTTAPEGSDAIRYNVTDEGWSITEPSKMDDVIYSLQDKQIDMRRVMQSIMKTGKQVKDDMNAYLQEELFHGRAAKGVKDFLDFELRPMLKQMQDAKVDMGDFEEYLWNRHAEERNKQIAKINPEMQDGGSGIETADARAYLAGLTTEQRKTFEALAGKIDAMNKASQKVLVESGLEKQETIDAWNGAYKNYVPLQREDVDNGHVGTGKGFSVRGSSSKRAMGSGKNVVDIIANITMQRERNIVRAEKNRVSNALKGLAEQNPNPEFWTVDKAPTERVVEEKAIYTVLDKDGNKLGEFTRMDDADRLASKTPGATIDQSWGDRVNERVMPGFKSRDNVLLTRVNGEDHYIIFNERDERAMRMAGALKNLDVDNMGKVLSIVGKATRYLASINTQYNPVFGVINLIRDTQGALINLSSTPLAGEQKRVLGYTKDALLGIYKDIRDHRAGRKPSSKWAALFEEFQNEGGQTGYRDQYANAEARAESIISELGQFKEGKAKQLTRGVFGWLSDYNETMENAVRLAAYKAGTEKGMSKQQAASLAKNITVNFNRKGQVATQIGALYAFFNASVQGTARMAETLFEIKDGDIRTAKLSKAGKKIMLGGIMLGSMQALLLAAAGFGDDEPPEFIRERNLILPTGDGKYLTLAMPLGFHVIPGIGRIATEFVLGGGKDPLKHLAAFFSMFAESFNPVGSSGFSLQTITPSVVDPFAALAENKDFTGKEIYRKDFNPLKPTPGHARAKDVATFYSRWISEGLNFITGGTEFKPGMLSWSPDSIDYLVAQAGGGVMREANKVFQTAGATYSGEDLPLHKIPLVGRFVGDTTGQSGEAKKFYDAIKQINMHKSQIDGLRENGRLDEAREYMAENPATRLVMAGSHTESAVRKLRDLKRDLVESDAGPDKVRAIDERITATMKAFNERSASITGGGI